jgi:hypothetical protein
MRVVAIGGVIAAGVAGLAACGGPSRPPARVITEGHLPPGAAHRTGNAPLTLKLSFDANGVPDGFASGSPDDADLIVESGSGRGITTAKITNRYKETLKVDLWIGPDGRRFVYTSSCPIRAGGRSLEMWNQDVPWVYVSNPRLMDVHSPLVCK